MRTRYPLEATTAIAVGAIWLAACAGKPENGPTILAGSETVSRTAQSTSPDPQVRGDDPEGPTLLPYRGPGSGGVAYRLTLEIEGERATRGSAASQQQPSTRESHTLEADFRKLPIEGADSGDDMFLVGLDRLHYIQMQENPPANRQIEIADDRLRVKINNETSVDNRGNRVAGPLAPRMFLNRIFGVISHDANGNPTKLSSRGAPAARQFMDEIPILGAIAYTMVTLPLDPITAGSRWTGVRIPPSHTGELGMNLTIGYSLAGFERCGDVPCAMIVLNADIREKEVTSLTGHVFDRVRATLSGTAWVDLSNSRVRRVVINERIQAHWTYSQAPGITTEHRTQHTTTAELALRDPNEKTERWSDGTPHFESN